MKKYEILYISGATGFGWEHACDSINEVESMIEEIKNIHTAMVTVYDNILNDFIFYKHALSKPDIDFLHDYNRDLRTTTRKRK